jgi:hypothetical protein
MCEDVWKDGRRVEVWENLDSYYKENVSCTTKSSRGYVRLYGKEEMIKIYIYSLPIYTANTLPDGICTWVMYSNGGEIKFGATSVQNAFEVGSSHKVLVLRLGATRIHGAGELRKNGDSIDFNTQSGTYTHEWIRSRVRARMCSGDELEEIITEKVHGFLSAYKLRLDVRTFITKVLPITDEEIARYKTAGFKVKEYETSKECYDDRSI